MNLSLRIFLSFWLAALILAALFFLFGHSYGNQEIERQQERMQAEAEIIAPLLLEGDRGVMRRWMRQYDSHDRPQIVNGNGENPMASMGRKSMHRQHPGYAPITPGIRRLSMGKALIVVELPGTTPPLYLIKEATPGHLERLPIAVWLLLAIIIVGLFSFTLARLLTRRILHLRQAAQQMANGDLSVRVSADGSDEVAALANDFNQMAERLSTLFTHQRQLVSDVSHELRSPLARLRIALELAERSKTPHKALTRIEKEADELEALVSDLLSLARLESGQADIEHNPIKLAELLQKIVVDANYEGVSRGVEVQLKTAPISEEIYGDPVLLHAAIENVVRNALRHSPENGTITIRCKTHTETVEIAIEDSGTGVPETDLPRLFEPFSRVEKARDRHSGGYGLGLAISGRTLLAHGGNILAENRVEGGLRVKLKLPLVKTLNQHSVPD